MLVIDPKAEPIKCSVIDLSVGGACLGLSKLEALPARFEFVHGGVRKSCTRVWVRGLKIGISFAATHQRFGVSGGLSRR